MPRHRTLLSILLSLVYGLFSSAPARAQLPERWKPCSPYPTLADEISDMRAETRAKTQAKTPQPKIIIDDLKFEGAIHLPQEILSRLIAEIKNTEFEGGSRWLSEMAEVPVTSAWQNQGYFTVQVTSESQVLSRDSASQHVSVTVHVKEGPQYRLGEITFRFAQDQSGVPAEFPREELRQQIPLREGDLFNVEKIREGLDALRLLYGSKGYIDFTSEPITRVDDAQTISVTIVLSEEKQYRVGSIEILGLDPSLESRLRSLIRPGDIMNFGLIEKFYKENRSALPPGASTKDDEFPRDVRTATVALRFDFRSCPLR